MKIIKPSAVLEWITPNAIYVIEYAARVCYKSEWKIEAPLYKDDPFNRSNAKGDKGSAPDFIKMIIGRNHLSAIEHASASIRFICDRGTSHELVRHRIASFSQESSRFCNYSKSRFGKEIQVIEPPFSGEQAQLSRNIWENQMRLAEQAYMDLLETCRSAQIARSVLPTCLKTEIVMTCNFREWRTVLDLRLDKKAHPQMRYVMALAARVLIDECPEIFEDYTSLVKEIMQKNDE